MLQKSPQSVFYRLVPIPYCNITSWFAIALAEIRTRRILREKTDCKQSNYPWLESVRLNIGFPVVRTDGRRSVYTARDYQIFSDG